MRLLKSILLLFLGIVCVNLWAVPVPEGFLIDQRHDYGPEQSFFEFQSINSAIVDGQEFIPWFDQLNFVQLHLAGMARNPFTSVLSVRIREGSSEGPILGTSESVTVPPLYHGIASFYFETTVPLKPGQTHIIQPVNTEGFSVLKYSFSRDIDYPLGKLINSEVQIEGDIWFREGLMVPEPSTTILAIGGIFVFGVLRRIISQPLQ